MRARHRIGFDRKVELAWLDAAASRVAAGATVGEVRSYLWRLLDEPVSGRKARRNTVTVLSHIWSQVPEDARALRDHAVRLLAEVPPAHRLALHWAMGLATYPFFADVVTALGRLLAIQGRVTLGQVTRRVVESWGDRSTITRATQRIVRSVVEWGALVDMGRGVYAGREPREHLGRRASWCVAAGLLHGFGGSGMAVDDLASHPAGFPFRLTLALPDLEGCPSLEVVREGGERTVVYLAGR